MKSLLIFGAVVFCFSFTWMAGKTFELDSAHHITAFVPKKPGSIFSGLGPDKNVDPGVRQPGIVLSAEKRTEFMQILHDPNTYGGAVKPGSFRPEISFVFYSDSTSIGGVVDLCFATNHLKSKPKIAGSFQSDSTGRTTVPVGFSEEGRKKLEAFCKGIYPEILKFTSPKNAIKK